MKITKKALSPFEFAQTYGFSEGTLANLRHAKKGPKFFKCGRKVLYFVEDVEAWIRQNPVLTTDSIDISA